ncbi:MAG: DUF4870 domain-containing protein [Methanosarcinales archaeon]|nr:DUF4870 domain-containing protein [Methanosarcinales archaeon]
MNETETKSDDNLIAALAYVFTIITGIIIYLMEKDKPDKRRFVMFHAVQAIMLGVAMIALSIIVTIIAMIPIIGWLIAFLFPFAALAVWIFMIYKAYSGEEYHLPIIGDYAEQYI